MPPIFIMDRCVHGLHGLLEVWLPYCFSRLFFIDHGTKLSVIMIFHLYRFTYSSFIFVGLTTALNAVTRNIKFNRRSNLID